MNTGGRPILLHPSEIATSAGGRETCTPGYSGDDALRHDPSGAGSIVGLSNLSTPSEKRRGDAGPKPAKPEQQSFRCREEFTTMRRAFLNSPILANEWSHIFLECGRLEALELEPSSLENERTKFKWTSQKCSLNTGPIDAGVLHPPVPIPTPDSTFRSKYPVWTIDDFSRRFRFDRYLFSIKTHMKSMLKFLRYAQTPDNFRWQRQHPFWFTELVNIVAEKRGSFADSKYLKNCLATVRIAEKDFLFCHPVGNDHKTFLIYKTSAEKSDAEAGTTCFSSSKLLCDQSFSTSIDQVDAQFNVDNFGSKAKVVCRTKDDVSLWTLNPTCDDDVSANSGVSYCQLGKSDVVDICFNPHIESEFAILDSLGQLVLVDLEYAPSPSSDLHEITTEDSICGVKWTDHPRLLLLHNSSELRQADVRTSQGVHIWMPTSIDETIEMVESMPHDPNYAFAVTNRSVYLIDIRRKGTALNTCRHMLVDRPKFCVVGTPFSSEYDRLIFVGGRETGDVVACNFSLSESGTHFRVRHAPFQLQGPDEPMLWLKSHEPTATVPRNLVRRLRAPLRGLHVLPFEMKDRVAPLMLTDVGDVFYQICGDLSLKRESYADSSMIDFWSDLLEQSRAEFESSRSKKGKIVDLSKIVVLPEKTRDTVEYRVDQCPLCSSTTAIEANGVRKCNFCHLTVSDAKDTVKSDLVGRYAGEDIDPGLVDPIPDSNIEHDATAAILRAMQSSSEKQE